MNFIKRAILSLKSRLSKTMILFAVMLTVCVVVLSSFGIKSATIKAGDLARQKLGAEVSLAVDMEKIKEQQMGGSGEKLKFNGMAIPLEYLDELKESEYVIGYNVSSSHNVTGDDFKAVGSDESEDDEMSMMNKFGGVGDLTLMGVDELETSLEYQNGEIELLEGREITSEDDSNVVIIEETLASENDIKLNDKITILDSNNDDKTIEVEVVGIYKTHAEFSADSFRSLAQNPYNKIYAPYKMVNELKGEDYNNAVDSMMFYLNDPISVDKFIEEGQNTSIDFDTFTLDGSTAEYEAMMGPIENVASFSNTTLILVTIFGGLILGLIIMLSIKDRMNEIGILLSLGESKVKIVLQLLTEVLCILIISLGVSMMAGNTVSNVMSEQLLSNELSVSSEQSMNQGPGMGGRPGMGSMYNDVEAIDELEVQITTEEFANMSMVAMLVAFLGTIIPSSLIMRLHPKSILSQHN